MTGSGTGTVVAFDEHTGLGAIAPADGTASLPFHCVSIADGSRVVPVDAAVRYRRAGGVGGRWEAVDVAAVRAAGPPDAPAH